MVRRAVAALLVVIVVIGLFASFGASQQEENPQQPQQAETVGKQLTDITSFGTFWELIEKAGWLRWLIFAVFVVGLFLVFAKTLELILEKRQLAKLIGLDFHTMSLGEIRSAARQQTDNVLSRLLTSLITLYQSAGSTQGFNEEISNYLRLEKDRFDTFRVRMAFLSDTAGALGLLGTVWGIFTVFFGGTLDKQLILNGMAVALLTTLLGIIVSIVLNLTSTEVYGVFNHMLDRVASKAYELRSRLMEIGAGPVEAEAAVVSAQSEEILSENTPPVASISVESEKGTAVAEAETLVAVETETVPETIEITSVPPKQVPVGTPLEPAIGGRVLDPQGQPVPGIPVRCEVVRGDGHLGDGSQELVCTTDQHGGFEVSWTVGQSPGKQALGITAAEALYEEVTCQAVAGPPHSLRIVSGNHQGAVAGSALPRPMVVEVLDRFKNPVTSGSVHFAVQSGDGHFEAGGTEQTVETDKTGRASVGFVLGAEPGLNEVRAAVDAGRLSVTFQVFGEEA